MKGRAVEKPSNPLPVKISRPPRLKTTEPKDDDPLVPKQRRKMPSAQERSFTYNGNGAFQRLIYGEVHNVGGLLTWWKAYNGDIVVKYDISYGEIEEISNLRLEDKPISNWAIGYEIKLGTPGQAVSTILNTYRPPYWVPTNYPGIAHVILLIPATVSNKPDITQFQCDVKGKKVYDPTQDVTLTTKYYTEDPSLVIADLIISKRYGGRSPKETVNWTLLKDVTVPFCTGTISPGIKRYPVGLIFTEEQSLESAIQTIRLHAQLYISFYDGMYHIWPDTAKAHSGISFTDDDLFESAYFRSKGSSELFDKVIVEYTDSDNGWKDATTELERPGVANNTVELVVEAYSLKGTKYLQQATRINTYLINRGIRDKVYYFGVPFQRGFKPVPGDRVTLTESDNINRTGLELLITQVELDEAGYNYQAEIYDETIYSNTIVTNIVDTTPANASHYDAPPAPVSPIGLLNILSVGDGIEVVDLGVNLTFKQPSWAHGVTYKITTQNVGESEVIYRENLIGLGPFYVPIERYQTVRIYSVVDLSKVSSATALTAVIDPVVIYGEPQTPLEVLKTSDGKFYVGNSISVSKEIGTWTQSGAGITFFDATKLQDGNRTSGNAVQFNSTSTGRMIADLGSAKEINIAILYFSDSDSLGVGAASTRPASTLFPWNADLTLEYADNIAGPWTNAGTFVFSPRTGRVTAKQSGAGNHRYWSVAKGGLAAGTTYFFEIELLRSLGTEYKHIKGYRVRGVVGNKESGGTVSYTTDYPAQEFDLFTKPTATNPISQNFKATNYTYTSSPLTNSFSTSGNAWTYIEIATISPDNRVSDFRAIYSLGSAFTSSSAGVPGGVQQSWLPLSMGEYPVAPGTYNDIDIGYIGNILRVTPTSVGIITITGLVRGHSGRVYWIHNNGSSSVIISHESAGSTAANRFSIGADYTIPPGESLCVWYDDSASRWRLGGHQTSTGAGLIVRATTPSLDNPIINKASGPTYLEIQTNGTIRGYFGSAAASNDLITGSSAGDLIIRSQGTPIRVSSNSGTNTLARFFTETKTSRTGSGRGTLHLWNGNDSTTGDVCAITFGGGSGGDTGALSIFGQKLSNNGSELFFGTGNSWGTVTNTALAINYNGIVIVNSDASGISGSSRFQVLGNAGGYVSYFKGHNTSNSSYGLLIDAGTTSSDRSLVLRNASGATELLNVLGNGYLGILSTPTYPFSLADNGVTVSGVFNAHARFQKSSGEGIYLGYDTGASNRGIIGSGGTTNSLGFWTHNGSAWAERVLIESAGNLDAKTGLKIGSGSALTKHLTATTTWDPPSTNSGASSSTTITVTGAALGDEVTVSFSLTLQGCVMVGFVSATDTVTVVLLNLSGLTVNLGSGTLRASVWRH